MKVQNSPDRGLVQDDAVGGKLLGQQPRLEDIDRAAGSLERLEGMIGQEEPRQEAADDEAEESKEEVERHFGPLLGAVSVEVFTDEAPAAGTSTDGGSTSRPVYEPRHLREPNPAARYTVRP